MSCGLSKVSLLALLNNSDVETEGTKCVLLFGTNDVPGGLACGSGVYFIPIR